MNEKNIDYPHPLLYDGGDDYVDSSFDIDISKEEPTGNDFIISANYMLKCDGLEKMIADESAKVIITVQCVSLSYRMNFTFENSATNGSFKIPKDRVANKIEIIGYIVSSASMKSFVLNEHNRDYYNGVPFAIRKGDILAKSPQVDIIVDDPELEKQLSSIFDICMVEGMDMMIYPEFADDKIKIKLLPEVYNIYYPLRNYNNGTYRRALAGLIVLPVLTEAIDRIIGNLQSDERDEQMLEKRWCRAIIKKVREMNIDLENYCDSPLSLASKLLGDVVFDALFTFKSVIDDELSGEEIIRIGGED
jgi:hypothetical protein